MTSQTPNNLVILIRIIIYIYIFELLNNVVSFSHKTAYIGLNCAIKVIRGAVLMLPTQMSTRIKKKKRDRKRQ